MKRQSDSVNDDWARRYSELRLGTEFDLVPTDRGAGRLTPVATISLGPVLAPGVGRRGRARSTTARQFAGDEVGEGDLLEHRAQAGPDRDPDFLQVLGVAAVLDRLGRGRLDVGDRALDGADDLGDRHLVGRPGQPVAALGAAAGADDAVVLELEQDVLEELQRDVLGLGEALALDRALVGRRPARQPPGPRSRPSRKRACV